MVHNSNFRGSSSWPARRFLAWAAATCLLPGPPAAANPQEAKRLAEVQSVRFVSQPSFIRIIVNLESEVRYQNARISDPERLYFDLLETRMPHPLEAPEIPPDDKLLSRVRIGQPQPDVTRVVLDLKSAVDYRAFFMADPPRLVVELRRRGEVESSAQKPAPGTAEKSPSSDPVEQAKQPVAARAPAPMAPIPIGPAPPFKPEATQAIEGPLIETASASTPNPPEDPPAGRPATAEKSDVAAVTSPAGQPSESGAPANPALFPGATVERRLSALARAPVTSPATPAPASAIQSVDTTPLNIVVLEGEGALNDIRRRIGREPVVEVRDRRDRPVPGAQVTFTLPASGPSGTFAGGGRNFTAVADQQGRARAPDFKPNTIEGRFNIKVTAAFQGREGATIIAQSNTLAGGAVTAGRGGSSKKWLLLVGLAGGAAGGILAATHGGGSSAPPAAPPTPTVLSSSGVTVGGPR